MKRYNWKHLAAISLLGLIMALFALQIDSEDGMQQQSELLHASGNIEWLHEYRYGVRFALLGVPQTFNYPSKAKGLGAVKTALEGAGKKEVEVWYEVDTHGPIHSNEKYHDVWIIRVGGESIRTYEQTSSAWREDNKIAPWLGLAFLVVSIFLAFVSFREYINAQQ